MQQEVNFNLNELINATGLEKLAAMEKGVNAVYTNDETKSKFQILARAVFKKYKALQPNKAPNAYASRKNAIDMIYTAIEGNIIGADVTEIMKKIQNVVDASIENVVAESTSGNENGKIIDLSGLNFDLLAAYFLKAKNKNVVVQKLIEFISSLTEGEVATKRKGLTEEQKAVFDILRKPDLSERDKKKIKEIAIELLEELKKETLKIEQWKDKAATTASVFNVVSRTLFLLLPLPSYQTEDIDLKTNLLYEHLEHQYFGGGVSIDGRY